MPTPKRSSRDELLSIGAVVDLFTASVAPLGVPAMPWKFSYFHKSGFLKDSHVAYLQFSQDGMAMRGRGSDGIGVFFLKGQSDRDIEGVSWHIDKCYINLTNKGIDGTGPDAVDRWARNEAGEWVNDSVLATWGRSHVQHTGFISSGVGEVCVTEASFLHHKRVAIPTSRAFVGRLTGEDKKGTGAYGWCGGDEHQENKRGSGLEEFRRFNSHW